MYNLIVRVLDQEGWNITLEQTTETLTSMYCSRSQGVCLIAIWLAEGNMDPGVGYTNEVEMHLPDFI